MEDGPDGDKFKIEKENLIVILMGNRCLGSDTQR